MPHLGVLPKHTRVRSSSSQTLQGHMPHLGVLPKHPRVRSSSSQTAARPHVSPRGATKTHPGALIVFPDRCMATCRTWWCYQNTPGCAHRLPRQFQGHIPHLGVLPKHTRVRFCVGFPRIMFIAMFSSLRDCEGVSHYGHRHGERPDGDNMNKSDYQS